ncbi:transposable element Tc3 transposase [Trichonephila clavipes]|nr:transposable element Tc3 transposase [Trichonephila clavipes]
MILLRQGLKRNKRSPPEARRRFVEWAQNEIAVVPDFHKRILFSDEAHFWLNGYVNKQNSRIWSEANPQVYVETPLHPEKLTVWCALWAGGIIGPYFFKYDEGHNVTVNGDRYRAMITNFFIPELNNHDVEELWFQQDGATCHTARATIDLLKDTFGDRLISRFGPVNWPPRSCDLTPLDYFLYRLRNAGAKQPIFSPPVDESSRERKHRGRYVINCHRGVEEGGRFHLRSVGEVMHQMQISLHSNKHENLDLRKNVEILKIPLRREQYQCHHYSAGSSTECLGLASSDPDKLDLIRFFWL